MDLVMSVCDDIHVLDFGSIIASGATSLIRSDPAVQKAYLGYSDLEEPAAESDVEMTRTDLAPVGAAGASDETTVIPAVREGVRS